MRKSTVLLTIVGLALAAMPPVADAQIGSWRTVASPINDWSSAAKKGAILPDGSVVLVGAGPGFDQIEQFVSGTWSVAGVIPSSGGVSSHDTVSLGDGRVLVFGGCDFYFYCTQTSNTWVVDPEAGTVTAETPMNAARVNPTGILLPDGRVLVVGGQALAGADQLPDPAAEIYDLSAGTWTATGPMAVGLLYLTLTNLPDGTVLAVGVTSEDNTTEIYDPATDTWTLTGNLNVHRADQWGRVGHAATGMNFGALVVGGRNDVDSASTTFEAYDWMTRTWTLGSLPQGHSFREGNGLTTLPGGRRAVLTGGLDDQDQQLDTTLVFNPNSTWSIGASMNDPRSGHYAGLSGAKVIVVSGQSAEKFKPR